MAGDRLRKEIQQDLRVLSYAARSKAKGQPVEQLAESVEKRTASLIRHTCCFVCGTKQTHPDSIALWEQDRLGSECRRKFAGLTIDEALIVRTDPALAQRLGITLAVAS